MLGIYPLLDNAAYHAHDSISRSKLLDFAVSPYNYWALHLNPNRPQKEPTAAMVLGSAFHCMVLESVAAFDRQFAFLPEPKLLKDVGREEYDKVQAERKKAEESGLPIVTWAMTGTLCGMMDAIEAHPQAMELIEGGIFERSYFWKDKESGLLVKSRPDIVFDNMIVDLKTVNDASERSIQRAIFDYGYDWQMAMIQDAILNLTGKLIENFILLCIEKTYPYQIGIYILDEEIIKRASLRYKESLTKLKECQEKNEWPGYSPSTIVLPNWIKD